MKSNRKQINLFLHNILTHCLLTSADNHFKQFGPRSGPTESGSKLFDTQMVFLKDFFEKVDLEKTADDEKA